MKRAGLLLNTVLFCALASVAQSPVEHLRQLIAANTLDQEGKAPFHLKLEFQLYDLEGKPTEKGTVEEWWASPKLQRVVITAPSFTGVLTVAAPTLSEQQLRERELIKELLAAELHPLPNYQTFAGFTAQENVRTQDKLRIQCIVVGSTNPKAPSFDSPSYCTNPPSNALRLRTDVYGDTVSRNSVGTFHDTNVALDLQVAYQDKLAITGHVVTMNSFDPVTSKVDFTEPDVDRFTREQIPDTFAAGRTITRISPVFPAYARLTNTAGSVVLHAVISKQGPSLNL